MSDLDLVRAIGVALTGTSDFSIEPAGLAAGLAAGGWDAARIKAHADAVVAGGGVWPHPVPGDLRDRVGAARLRAAVQAAQQDLGLFGRVALRPPERPLTADERRLLAEKPPHHGG